MSCDLVIRGGLLVDGLGAEPTPADVAVDGDRVVAVGTVHDRGRREVDADGRLVTPGFIDIHTHLDAQLGWDPLPQPECVYDYPAGAGRYVQHARGYGCTVVNGAVFMEDGEPTGALAGRILRAAPAAR